MGCLNYFFILSMIVFASWARLFFISVYGFLTVRPTMYLIALIKKNLTNYGCGDFLDALKLIKFNGLFQTIKTLAVESIVVLNGLFYLSLYFLMVLRLTDCIKFSFYFYLVQLVVHQRQFLDSYILKKLYLEW